jgi:prepilin-type N-terminal cleavage/methylation domain-containing protein
MLHKTSNRKTQGGFTLVELLMAISIIVILSTLTIAVLRSAEDDARASRTKSVLANVRTVIQRRMEAYETRRLPFRLDDVGVTTDLDQMREIRKRMLAEWFRAEMPTQLADLEQFPSSATIATEPLLAERLLRRPPAMVSRLRRALRFNTPNGTGQATHGNNATNQSAECLYAILQNSWDGDRRGTHFLSPQEIGDTDGDGMQEVLDAWGDPLQFVILVARDSNGDGQVDATDDRTLDPDRPMELNDFQMTVDSDNLQ